MLCFNRNILSISLRNAINIRCCHVDTKNHYDIVIAGGGMIGGTLACTLGIVLIKHFSDSNY